MPTHKPVSTEYVGRDSMAHSERGYDIDVNVFITSSIPPDPFTGILFAIDRFACIFWLGNFYFRLAADGVDRAFNRPGDRHGNNYT
jgi:hypothetical protein